VCSSDLVAVTVADIRTISSLEGYTAVVIGAPLYMGRLPAEVPKFTEQYREQLVNLPVAAFAVGFAPLSKEAGAVEQAMEILKNTLAPLQPVASALFAGKLDPAKLNFLTKKFMEVAKIPSGDHRNWDVIASWAKGLPKILII
jgi:menaquinone-dependent protoporphyrinogen oxidase